MLSGDAATEAADRLVERLTRIAAHLLEAAPDDVVFEGGRFGVRSSRVGDVADRAARSVYHAPHLLPPDERAELEEWGSSDPPGRSPTPRTSPWSRSTLHLGGEHRALPGDRGLRGDDQPLIVDGQISGGVAQGIGAALYERLVFDDEGQPLAASFMDYLVPTATEVPPIEIAHLETPSTVSVTGRRGWARAGRSARRRRSSTQSTTPSPLGIEIDRIPVTPDDIARAAAAPLTVPERATKQCSPPIGGGTDLDWLPSAVCRLPSSVLPSSPP